MKKFLIMLLPVSAMLVLYSCSGPRMTEDEMFGSSASADQAAPDGKSADVAKADELFVSEDPIVEDKPADSSAPVANTETNAATTPTEATASTATDDQMNSEFAQDSGTPIDSKMETTVANGDGAAPVDSTLPAAGATTAATGNASEQASSFESSGGVASNGTYTVGKNETLMLIAFKIYGDYRKWKGIAKMNQDVLNGGQNVSAGMVLKYEPPREEFVWSPEGNPYLIKWGDTLGKISKKVYSVVDRWKEIWDNNKPMIKDPNKIFAGFTIYYKNGTSNVAFK